MNSSRSLTSAASFEIGRSAVGRMRPDHVRLELREIDLEHAIVVPLGIRFSLRIGFEQVRYRSTSGTRSPRRVALRYSHVRSSAGKIDVVAPSSAPILVIVALPVALIVRAPGPMYSTIAVGAAGHGELSGDVEDHVLRRGPAAQLAGENDGDAPADRAPPTADPRSLPPRPRRRRQSRKRRDRPRWACANPCR